MKLPTGVTPAVVECKVRGCGWQAEIPVLYRLEAHRNPSRIPDEAFISTRVVVDRAAVEAFDAYIAGHLEQHAFAETVLDQIDDPGPPYRGGETVDYLDELVDDEPDGWRAP